MNEEEKITFLIVDDSNISRKWLIEAIPENIKNSVTIIEAGDGESALEIYKNQKIGIVFLDITMPKMSGFDVLEELIKYDENALVIMVSADRQKSTKAKVLSLGAKGILNKPVTGEDLREILLELIK